MSISEHSTSSDSLGREAEQVIEGIAATSRAVSPKCTPIREWIVGEFFGTFLLIFFGCGSVAVAVVLGGAAGVFQVAMVWGLAVATAIYLTGSLSGAHLNPAVTLALAVWSDFPKRRVVPYVVTRMLGAMAASAVLFLIFGDAIAVYEREHGIVRGAPGSEATAMIYGEYFPNPGGKPLDADAREKLSASGAFLAEVVGTAILVLVIFCVTDARNATRPQLLTPLTIGLTVGILVCLLGPMTMACLNPARDFGPRLFSALAGWKMIPFTTNGFGWLTVYVLAPLVGGVLGGFIYRVFFKPYYFDSMA